MLTISSQGFSRAAAQHIEIPVGGNYLPHLAATYLAITMINNLRVDSFGRVRARRA